MTTNLPASRSNSPLARRRDEPSPVDPVEQLHQHVRGLNNLRWVADSGKLYFVGRRQKPDGTTEHFVDRQL